MTPSIVDAMTDPKLFGRWFAGATWAAWRAFLAALFALPMTEAQAALYRTHTGRTALPTMPAREGWVIAGRRAGKSFIAALIAVFLACFRDYRRLLAPGERGVVMVLAADRRQARVTCQVVGIALLAGVREAAFGIDAVSVLTVERSHDSP